MGARVLPPHSQPFWQLPGRVVPEGGAIVRTLECSRKWGDPFTRAWEADASAGRRGDLAGCVVNELSAHMAPVPASSVRREGPSLFFQERVGSSSEGDKLVGWLLRGDHLRIERSYAHDVMTPAGSADVHGHRLGVRCNNSFTAQAYARLRANTVMHLCPLMLNLSTADRPQPRPAASGLQHVRFALDAAASRPRAQRLLRHAFAHGALGCWFGARADAEAAQREYLGLLRSNSTVATFDVQPLHNQIMVRYDVRAIAGIFHSPKARAEAEIARRAIASLAHALDFGVHQQSLLRLELIELRPPPGYRPTPTSAPVPIRPDPPLYDLHDELAQPLLFTRTDGGAGCASARAGDSNVSRCEDWCTPLARRGQHCSWCKCIRCDLCAGAPAGASAPTKSWAARWLPRPSRWVG